MHSHHTEGWYDLSTTVCRNMMVASIDWYLELIVRQDHFWFVCSFSDIVLWIWGTFSIYGFHLGGKAYI